MDKLSIEQAEILARDIKEKSPTQGLFRCVLEQLADTMRENEKLYSLLKRAVSNIGISEFAPDYEEEEKIKDEFEALSNNE